MTNLIYLAAPYSHPDPAVRQIRFEQINRVAAEMMRSGLFVFSPISHTHPIALAGSLPGGFDYWRAYNLAMLERSQELAVLRLDGWEESVGVQTELVIARDLGLPIGYMDLC